VAGLYTIDDGSMPYSAAFGMVDCTIVSVNRHFFAGNMAHLPASPHLNPLHLERTSSLVVRSGVPDRQVDE
jgi:hypothetical protein